MQLVDDNEFVFERVWIDDDQGAVLRVTHVPSGKTTERLIGFNADGQHRKDLITELRRLITTQFPPEHLEITDMWLGPGKGAALRMRHTPTGRIVERVIGYDSRATNLCGMFAELLQQLK
jgi:hypothetical protein